MLFLGFTASGHLGRRQIFPFLSFLPRFVVHPDPACRKYGVMQHSIGCSNKITKIDMMKKFYSGFLRIFC